MSETKKDIKKNKILNAVAHVAWIMIISVAIIFLMNELFRGSDIGKILTLILISSYIIFSFARRFWIEKRTKELLHTIDMMVALVGGLFLIIVSFGCDYCENIGYAISGSAGAGTQPNMVMLYVGMLLLLAGLIKVYIMNKHQETFLN